MAETEVEIILREIRERVLSQQRAGQDLAESRRVPTNRGNGAGQSDTAGQITHETPADENLSLVNSYLTTTARAWDRLPPLVSNRSGLTARIELWLKRQIKRVTHWFTWEQVNFNAAVHHALRDVLPLLAAQEHSLRTLLANAEARQTELEHYQAELTTQQSELRAEIDSQIHATEAQRIQVGAGFGELRAEIDSQIHATEAQRIQVAARFGELINELHEREQQLQDEQRVCLKQLSLETSEAAVPEDRARRKIETLLAELQGRIAELESGKK
ncbi:MAG: hypothetical protein ABJC10_04235 [Acidobacteriota bacterium]